MFQRKFGNVTIQTKAMAKRGMCLHISKEDGQYILADYCGMNPMLVPDGTNGYFFGNKLIMVTRWSDMSQEEKDTVEKGELVLVVHPHPCLQFSLQIDGKWSDVMMTLHNFCRLHNDENLPVDEIIFVFADTHDGDYITARAVKVPQHFAKFLQTANEKSLEVYCLDELMGYIKFTADNDPTRDEFDIIYGLCYERTKAYGRSARSCDPANVPDGIYLSIDSSNVITNIYRKDSATQAQMSDEAKTYLRLAEKGDSVAQYNLGVCYETGDGVEKNLDQAFLWYKKSSDQGYAKAQHNLAVCFYQGWGTPVNLQEAARLFKLSADQGDMYAQFNLGAMYTRGEGVQKDPSKAIEYIKKAAQKGHPQAKAFVEKFGL